MHHSWREEVLFLIFIINHSHAPQTLLVPISLLWSSVFQIAKTLILVQVHRKALLSFACRCLHDALSGNSTRHGRGSRVSVMGLLYWFSWYRARLLPVSPLPPNLKLTPPAPALCLCLAQPVRGLQWKGCKLWIRVVGRAVCGSFRMKIWSHIKWKHSHFYFDRETQNAHTLLINFRGSFLGKPFLGSPCPTVRKANWDSWRQIPFLSFRSHGKTH